MIQLFKNVPALHIVQHEKFNFYFPANFLVLLLEFLIHSFFHILTRRFIYRERVNKWGREQR